MDSFTPDPFAGQLTFLTDDELDRRLEMVENWLADLMAKAASMRRQLHEVRGLLSTPAKAA